jgi:hypothetical protein
MFGSTILDVAIGMIFVYLLLSLLCSAINEYIEAHLNYRSDKLWQGIQLLLNGKIGKEPPDTQAPQKNAAKSADARKATEAAATLGKEAPTPEKHDLASELYQHGLIRALYKDKGRLPSYIPSRTFALALWNMAYQKLKDEGVDIKRSDVTGVDNLKNLESIKQAIDKYIPNPELSQALITLIDEADGNFDKAVKNVEDWYDSAMDRVSGWYKRHVQWILLGIGFAVAILINADSVNIARALFEDKTLRDAVVAHSDQFLRTHDENGAPTGGNTNSRGANSNAANANTANSNTANANTANANTANANTTNSNARRAHAAQPGGSNANAANANGGSPTAVNANTANTSGENSNSANTNSANTNGGGAGQAKGKDGDKPTPLEEARQQLYSLGLPLGWLNKSITQDPLRGFPHVGDGGWNALCWLLLKLFGLFLTGLAISQGAPFWFDLLNKFMVIRSTVKPKEKSPNEGSKD